MFRGECLCQRNGILQLTMKRVSNAVHVSANVRMVFMLKKRKRQKLYFRKAALTVVTAVKISVRRNQYSMWAILVKARGAAVIAIADNIRWDHPLWQTVPSRHFSEKYFQACQ